MSQFRPAPINKLITRYVHSGNKEIQPTSLDTTTGIFTTNKAIGLPAGAKRDCIIAVNYTKNGSMPREFKAADAHQIEIIDDYNFYVLVSGTRLVYTNSGNTALDIASFHFEYDHSTGVTIDLSSFDLSRTRMAFYGGRNRSGWSYVYLGLEDNGTTWEHNFGTFSDGRDIQPVYFELFFEIRGKMIVGEVDKYMTGIWNESNGTWSVTHAINSLGTAIYQRTVAVPKVRHLRLWFGMANGCTVEFYDTGGR